MFLPFFIVITMKHYVISGKQRAVRQQAAYQRRVLFSALLTGFIVGMSIFTPLRAQTSCPLQRITAPAGSFADRADAAPTSQTYQANQDCYWLVQPPNAQIIRLTFLRFSTEVNADILTVYDGADTNAPVRAQLSGQTLPQPITSSGGALLLRFRTNAAVQDRGWALAYTSSISRQAITAAPNPLAFRPILFGESSVASITLTVPETSSGLVVRASSAFQIALGNQSSSVFSDTLSLNTAQIQAQSSQITLSVRFRPNAVGRFSGTLNAVNGARELTIPITAQALPAIYWKPASGPFGASVQSLAIAPNQTIFAGTLTGVYRSAAAGAAWLQALGGLNANSELTIQTLAANENAAFAGTQVGLFARLITAEHGRKFLDSLIIPILPDLVQHKLLSMLVLMEIFFALAQMQNLGNVSKTLLLLICPLVPCPHSKLQMAHYYLLRHKIRQRKRLCSSSHATMAKRGHVKKISLPERYV